MKNELETRKGTYTVFSAADPKSFVKMIMDDGTTDIEKWMDSVLLKRPSAKIDMVFMGCIDICKDPHLKSLLLSLSDDEYFIVYCVREKRDLFLLSMFFKPIIDN